MKWNDYQLKLSKQIKINEMNKIIKSIYRLIMYSRHHVDDNLLHTSLMGIHNLKDLLRLKKAQMEAQHEEEAKKY